MRQRTLLSLLATASAVSAAPAGQANSSQIKWLHNCNPEFPGLDCGTLQVPMDWNNTSAGDYVTLSILRVATNSTNRIGSLFLNPGGPGGSAQGYCTSAALRSPAWSEEILDRFDLICPDPRGVSATAPIKCDTDLWMQTPSYFIDSEESFAEVVAFNKKLGASCLNMTGPLLGYVDTTSAAKDLDAIREALGEEKMNWLGYSYGTQLGSAYAELFPDKIRAMVLDGVLDHAQWDIESFVVDNWAMEDEVSRLLHWCDTNSTCAFHNVSGGAVNAWTSLIASANANPIPAPGCGPDNTGAYTCKQNVTGYDIIFNLENDFRPQNWASISQNIKLAMDGNATAFANPAPRNVEGAPAPIEFPNLAIGCLDWQNDISTFQQHQSRTRLGKAMFPLTLGSGMALQWATTCIGWPFPATNPQHNLNATAMARAPPILMLQSTHDPATPMVDAQSLAAQMPSAVVLLRSGDGHTSYMKSPEMTRLTDAYLVNLTMPEQGTVVYDAALNPGGAF